MNLKKPKKVIDDWLERITCLQAREERSKKTTIARSEHR